MSPKKNFPPKKKRIIEDPGVAEADKILKEVSEGNEKRDDSFVFGEHVALLSVTEVPVQLFSTTSITYSSRQTWGNI